MKPASLQSLYDRDYYLHHNDGYRQFSNSGGKVLAKRLRKVLTLARIRAGMRVVDIGSGRGELVLHSARMRAHTLGIDISRAALDISRTTLRTWARKRDGIQQCAVFARADALRLPVRSRSTDIAFLVDMVEHVPSAALTAVMAEIKRILKPGGRLIIHTSPNKYYIPFLGGMLALFSKLNALAARAAGKKSLVLPWNVRLLLPRGLQKDYHVNEQSSRSLCRHLRRGGLLVEGIWFQLNPHYIDFLSGTRVFRLVNRLKKWVPLKHLFYADLICVARA